MQSISTSIRATCSRFERNQMEHFPGKLFIYVTDDSLATTQGAGSTYVCWHQTITKM